MKRRPDIVWRRVDGRIVALDLRSSLYYTFNASAAPLWDLLEHDVDQRVLTDALVEVHRIDPSTAQADAEAFVAELRGHGLLDA